MDGRSVQEPTRGDGLHVDVESGRIRRHTCRGIVLQGGCASVGPLERVAVQIR